MDNNDRTGEIFKTFAFIESLITGGLGIICITLGVSNIKGIYDSLKSIEKLRDYIGYEAGKSQIWLGLFFIFVAIIIQVFYRYIKNKL